MVPDTVIEPARVFPWRPKSYIVLSFLWKSKAYPIGTGQKIAYLFPAQSTKKCQSIAYIGFCEQAADELRTAMASLFLRPAK